MSTITISIHPSRVGWDCWPPHRAFIFRRFQSTHPVWDGTAAAKPLGRWMMYFNPPIPCGMGQRAADLKISVAVISIHPSRVGWDHTLAVELGKKEYFNPPIPCGMGRVVRWRISVFLVISIHPSRVGWDSKKYMITYISCDSYPFCQIFRLHKMTAYSYS